jgi:hypothetical protein
MDKNNRRFEAILWQRYGKGGDKGYKGLGYGYGVSGV